MILNVYYIRKFKLEKGLNICFFLIIVYNFINV